jgi:hypothetical protein
MLTEAEYQALRRQLEEERRKAEEEFDKNMEALERVYRLAKKASLPEAKKSATPDRNGFGSPQAETAIGKGDLLKAVRVAAKEVPDRFTMPQIVTRLRTKGVAAKRPSVRAALNRLQKLGEIELIAQGIGRRASEYRRVSEQ